jgi:predicted transcriptional regulator
MDNTNDTPRYTVVSMRVSDAERHAFQQIALQKKLSISKVMRQAMEQFTNNRYNTKFGHVA